MHTDQFVEEIKTVARELGLVEPLVIRGEALNEKGLGGIYGVGKAADHEVRRSIILPDPLAETDRFIFKPALVILSHKPPGAVKTVAWVGKGIVYDTGGLSIKVR
jgi:probable aminopeptidase NPEPL1